MQLREVIWLMRNRVKLDDIGLESCGFRLISYRNRQHFVIEIVLFLILLELHYNFKHFFWFTIFNLKSVIVWESVKYSNWYRCIGLWSKQLLFSFIRACLRALVHESLRSPIIVNIDVAQNECNTIRYTKVSCFLPFSYLPTYWKPHSFSLDGMRFLTTWF